MPKQNTWIKRFKSIGNADVATVGGKNASLGEMFQKLDEAGLAVPDGFATTADAYRRFLEENELEKPIRDKLDAFHSGAKLSEVGKAIRALFLKSEFPKDVAENIREAYRELSKTYETENVDVAVRSSATAEDLPEASFAGQQETYLNVTGEEELIEACRKCFASLFTDRAISYRENNGFDHMKVALSAGVQKMVRSDKAGAGVMFTIDTETGFPDIVLINAAWGLGENVVKGEVSPDQYMVYTPLLKADKEAKYRPIIQKTLGEKAKKMIYGGKGGEKTENIDASDEEQASFVLSDDEILKLARWGSIIEDHYGKPMDIEWAKDGERDELYIVQARPETVESRKQAGTLKTYTLGEKGERLLTGLSIGGAIAAGPVCKIESSRDLDKFEEGGILVTEMTDPDWVPIMKKAAGIVTDTGGRTCHAAIVSRELGIPAVVGTGKATSTLKEGQNVTISCAEGDQGYVYDGLLEFEAQEIDLTALPKTRTPLMMNAASPGGAFRWWQLPVKGIGLARMEFIINNHVKVHPMALIHPDRVERKEDRERIDALTRGYADKTDFFVDVLARGIGRIAASQYPEKVVVRMSDFKTNEYAELLGGSAFEPKEENPMLGFRGASRYYHERYREGFGLECRAIRKVREEMGFRNVIVMIPFCRTPDEADKVLEVMADNGLERGKEDLRVYVMCEIPSNVVLARQFSSRFDGFSIGSNDLTQLVLGVDRDSDILSGLFDERNEAVKEMIRMVIHEAHACDRPVGICGEAPSNYPEFAAFLVKEGIDSISLNPDSVSKVIPLVAEAERQSPPRHEREEEQERPAPQAESRKSE